MYIVCGGGLVGVCEGGCRGFSLRAGTKVIYPATRLMYWIMYRVISGVD